MTTPDGVAEKRLAKIRTIFETCKPIKGSRSTVSTHAAFNLEGAIIDIGEGRCDRVTLQTLNRVAKQLHRIAKVLDL